MYHLAQLNIARLLHPIDHPQISEFVDNLDRINQLAERSPGFAWRLQDETGNATEITAFDDPMIIVNMSVWESLEALKNFTFQSDHLKIMGKRRQWFEKPASPYLVLWWIPIGHRPTLQEAKSKLENLRQHGERASAFSFRQVFPPPLYQE